MCHTKLQKIGLYELLNVYRVYRTVRGRTYVMLVAVVLGVIFLNALYGHHLYDSLYDQSLNKYSVYVHLQPGWNSAPANILYDVTVSWNGESTPDAIHYNTNTVSETQNKLVVLLRHGFSDCNSAWSPPLYRYGVDQLRSVIRNAQGLQLNLDPYVPRLPDMPNTSYSKAEQASLVKHGYAQFIPVCISSESSSFVYTVSVNDPDIGFDVHFVPSLQEAEDYFSPDTSFDEYDCAALNRHSYTGYCSDVGPESGLLVVLPDRLQQSLTQVTVSLQEIS